MTSLGPDKEPGEEEKAEETIGAAADPVEGEGTGEESAAPEADAAGEETAAEGEVSEEDISGEEGEPDEEPSGDEAATDAETEDAETEDEETEDDPLKQLGREVATAVGGKAEVAFGTIKVRVPPDRWVVTHEKARDELDLPFFSFLGVIEWTNETATGDPLSTEVEEHFEVITTVSDVTVGRRITFSTTTSHTDPVVPSLVDVYAGANWHERESHEMFGVHFDGHPDLSNLYLPDGFVGNPLRKSFALLSREVKPWPGKVDVEGMPDEEEDGEAPADDETESSSAGNGESPAGEETEEE